MTRAVLYVAHCLRPSEGEIHATRPEAKALGWNIQPEDHTYKNMVYQATRINMGRAERWLAWLRKSFPETTFIAPWIAALQSGEDDADPRQREAGLVDACAVIERCDGIVLCGPRISSGMRREAEHGRVFRESIKVLHHGMTIAFAIYDLTGGDPPTELCNLSRGGLHANAFGSRGFEFERSLICLSRMGTG